MGLVLLVLSGFLLFVVIVGLKMNSMYKYGYEAGKYDTKRQIHKMLQKESEKQAAYALEGELNLGIMQASLVHDLSLKVLK